jgi:hypothetical protein
MRLANYDNFEIVARPHQPAGGQAVSEAYILIIIGSGGLHGLGFTATFQNKDACEHARATAMETFTGEWKSVVKSMCVPYATNPPEGKP